MHAFINPNKCTHCHICEASKACAINAIIRIDESEPSIIDVKYCRGCGDCIENCPSKAISLKNSF